MWSARLRFRLACLRRDEAFLAAYSLPMAALAELASDRSVALVGNARALSDHENGAAIDGHDIVVRLNTAPLAAAVSHGTRTDWLAMSVPVGRDTLAARDPQVVLWMTRNRKRLPWHVATRPGFALFPADRSDWLAAQLAAPPSTGMMVISLLHGLPLARLSIYGFDFFASLSQSGRRTAAEVPHDFAAEQRLVARMIAQDARLTLC